MKNVLKKLSVKFAIFLLYLLISVVMFFPRWTHLTTHYGTPDFDTDGTIWYQWARIFTEKKEINFAYTNELIAYPYGYDVSYIPYFSLIYEANILAMKALGGSWSAVIAVANTSTLLTFSLSAFSAFLLTYYLTRKVFPSFISGIIFGFSYYHVMMMGGSLSLNHIQLIPVFYLSFVYFLDKPNWKSILLSSFAFALLFMSNAYWAFFSMVFTPVFFCFYGVAPLKKRVQLALVYYPSVLSLTILANLDYIWNQLYNLSPYHLQYVFPKVGSVRDQLLNTTSFFSPSLNSVFRPWSYSKGDHFLGYAALGLTFAAFFTKKKHRNYGIFLGCMLLAILLASKVSPFIAINELYFTFFRAFRAVSRLVILASLFLGVTTAYALEYLVRHLSRRLPQKRNMVILSVLGLLLTIMILVEGFTLNGMNRRLTSFDKIASLYQPVKDNDDIKKIVTYPLEIAGEGDGFPHNYVLLGQVIHEKILVGGLSRSTPQARSFQDQIVSLSNPSTIDVLTAANIDTIMIYDRMYGGSEQDVNRLKTDSRVTYIGTYEQPKDESTYVSANDLSRKISLFQINQVVENNKLSTSSTSDELNSQQTEGSFSFEQVSAQEYRLYWKDVRNPIKLIFSEPYSTKWQLLPGNRQFLPFAPHLFASPVMVAGHHIVNDSVNSWEIDPQASSSELPSPAYVDNQDGTYDLSLVLYFMPAQLQQISEGIRVMYFVVMISIFVFYTLHLSLDHLTRGQRAKSR